MLTWLVRSLLAFTTIGGAQPFEARDAKAKADISTITQAIERMHTDTGSSAAACLTNPALLANNAAPTECGRKLPLCNVADSGALCWGGPYLTVPRDPWGNAYVVTYAGGRITVSSMGPDGKQGTPDDISS